MEWRARTPCTLSGITSGSLSVDFGDPVGEVETDYLSLRLLASDGAGDGIDRRCDLPPCIASGHLCAQKSARGRSLPEVVSAHSASA